MHGVSVGYPAQWILFISYYKGILFIADLWLILCLLELHGEMKLAATLKKRISKTVYRVRKCRQHSEVTSAFFFQEMLSPWTLHLKHSKTWKDCFLETTVYVGTKRVLR